MLAAEEPSKIRGGARFGGRPGLENYVGEVTKHVVVQGAVPGDPHGAAGRRPRGVHGGDATATAPRRARPPTRATARRRMRR